MEKFNAKIIICTLIAVFSAHSQALIIISDLDDTIKVTNTRSTSERNYNALFNSAAFTGAKKSVTILFFV